MATKTIDTKNQKIKVKDTDPEALIKQDEAKDEQMEHFLTYINNYCESIKDSQATYRERQTRWFKSRFNIRNPKKFPWPGASNIGMPVVDTHIRKTKPYYMQMWWPNDSVCEFKIDPTAPEDLMSILRSQMAINQEMFSHIIKDKIPNVFRKTVRATDRMLQAGKVIIKVPFKYQEEMKEYDLDLEELPQEKKELIANNATFFDPENGKKIAMQLLMSELDIQHGVRINLEDEDEKDEILKNVEAFQNGKTKLKFKIRDIKSNCPNWIIRRPENVLVPGSTMDIQDAEIICDEDMHFNENELRKMAASGKFGKKGAKVIERILDVHADKLQKKGKTQNTASKSVDSTTYDSAVAKMTGDYHTSYNFSNKITIREVCCYAMPEDSGIMQKCVVTYCPDYLKEPIKFIKLDYQDGLWPYVDLDLEVLDEGWLSPRGLPAMLDYLATAINIGHNQRRNLITMAVPMFKYLNSKVNLSTIKFVPGQGIPLQDMNALDVIDMSKSAINLGPLLQEEMILKEYGENYLSSPDFGLSDFSGGAPKERKATEILQISAQRDVVVSLDAKIFLDSLHRLFQMTWSRWLQYGSDSYSFRNPDDKQFTWKRSPYEKFLRVKSKGTYYDTNPLLKQQKADQLAKLGEHPRYGAWYKEEYIAKYLARAILPEEVTEFMNTDKTVKELRQAELEKIKLERDRALAIASADKQQTHLNDMELENLKGNKDIEKEIVKIEGKENDEGAAKKATEQ